MRHKDLRASEHQRRSSKVTLVVGSTNAIWLTGFLHLVDGLRHIEVVGFAETARDLMQRIDSTRPDVLVVDARLVPLLHALCGPQQWTPRVLVVGPRSHPGTRPVFNRECSCGYASESAAWPQMARRIAHVAACAQPRAGLDACLACPIARSHLPPDLPLSEREAEVFVRIGWGEGPNTIAEALGVQVKTVDAHREALKYKLGLRSAVELREAAVAWREGDLLPGSAMSA